MSITVGTFNLNNLFSRFNFEGAVEAIQNTDGPAGSLTIRYEFTDPDTINVRTFLGKLVKAKDPVDTQRIADRINLHDVDVLAVQEVEHVNIMREFNREFLGNRYAFQVLIEGNDPRFIDVGVLSKLPIGAVTSHQTAVHPEDPARPVFGRDLLEVEIWNGPRTKKLLTLYNNHLKSHFVPHDQDPIAGADAANTRRRRQAEVVARIVEARVRPNSRYIITGDMNDPPDSPHLAPMIGAPGLGLVDGLASPEETRLPKDESTGLNPQTTAWTYRHLAEGKPQHLLFDHIWLSPALADQFVKARIDRRQRHGGDGSDHDMAWVELDL